MQNAAFNNVTLSGVGFLKPISKMTFVEAKLFLRASNKTIIGTESESR